MRWSLAIILGVVLQATVAGAAIPSDPSVYVGNCGDTDHGPGCSDPECTACVCDTDSKCCNDDWSFDCLQAVPTGGCSDECYRVAGNCAEVRPEEAGCSEAACEACVCGVSPSCCTDEWTFGACVLETVGTCFPECADTGRTTAPALSVLGIIAVGMVVLGFGVFRLRTRD